VVDLDRRVEREEYDRCLPRESSEATAFVFVTRSENVFCLWEPERRISTPWDAIAIFDT
jgi:hypothetical protein